MGCPALIKYKNALFTTEQEPQLPYLLKDLRLFASIHN